MKGDRAADAAIGRWMHGFAAELFPIFRSITGAGLRQTLDRIGREIPLDIVEVPTGTRVLDWEIPQEWRVRGARLEAPDGAVILDIAASNLHLLHYSHPVDRVVSLEELQRHLHSIPDQPDRVPYRTSYYAADWGFCLSERQRRSLDLPAYRVRIDTELIEGSLSYGECRLPGESSDEFLLSVHCCHPSLANDNLSGIAVATAFARRWSLRRRRHSCRLLFIPGTIGSIAWLAAHREKMPPIRHGLVLTCLGDAGKLTYKRTRHEDREIDRIAAAVVAARDGRVERFVPWGYDERQYNSPGFDLPVGCLMRSPNATFPEYHTSGDDLSFIHPEALAGSLEALDEIALIADGNETLINHQPFGEPQLGRRGLYRPVGGAAFKPGSAAPGYDTLALLWVLNQSDGRHSLLDIALRSAKPFAEIRAAADALAEAGLVGPA